MVIDVIGTPMLGVPRIRPYVSTLLPTRYDKHGNVDILPTKMMNLHASTTHSAKACHIRLRRTDQQQQSVSTNSEAPGLSVNGVPPNTGSCPIYNDHYCLVKGQHHLWTNPNGCLLNFPYCRTDPFLQIYFPCAESIRERQTHPLNQTSWTGKPSNSGG